VEARPRPTQTSRHTFSASHDKKEHREMAPHKDDEGPKKKKKKTYQHSEKKDGDKSTSDGSDSSPCWSDYERTPGTAAGTKGSCRPKGSKKKSED
jgi:hypothetical protein